MYGTITRTMGGQTQPLANVKYTVLLSDEEKSIRFEYDFNNRHYDFKHPIIKQPVNFGGYRYFFRCNCTKNGRYCGRRVKALYFGGNIWACRHCLDLVYYSCRYHRDGYEYLHKAELLEQKAKKLRERKHPRKAERLLWQVYDLNTKSLQVMNERFYKLCGYINRS